MFQQANIFPINDQMSYFGPATVLENETQNGLVKIRFVNQDKPLLATAEVAIARNSALTQNMKVLISGNDVDQLYVIGVLNLSPVDNLIKTDQGAFAQKNKETLAVYSENRELLFEYDPVNQISKVNVQHGDLELNTLQGNIKLNAGKTIEINGDTLCLNSKKLSINAILGNMILGRLETTTDTLIENAKNVYRNVKELSQLRAGRKRTFIDETYQINANKVLLKSENDVKIKAEKIHLG